MAKRNEDRKTYLLGFGAAGSAAIIILLYFLFKSDKKLLVKP